MSANLTVRVYNVRFGDAVLVTVPDRDPKTKATTTRHILIDVGNAPLVASPEGGNDAAFKPVIDDIVAQLDGRPVDLYVMTHEHLDHTQGLPYAAWKLYPGKFEKMFKVDHVWLTASADPTYYDQPNHQKAKQQKLELESQLAAIRSYLEVSSPQLASAYATYLNNNDPTKTSQCVTYLRGLNPGKTHYIHRQAKLAGKHSFREAKFTIWAPEEDTSTYYGHFQPVALQAPGGSGNGRRSAAVSAAPPAGVDLGAFLNLLDARSSGVPDNLLAIDQAGNNTSVVFLLEWRKWKLLFAGDAEIRSWQTMQREKVLRPIHFLKVSHHGSHNGTPDGEIFDAILPEVAPDKRKRVAAISTWTDTYGGIPHSPTNERLKSRCELHSTLDKPEALYYEIELPG